MGLIPREHSAKLDPQARINVEFKPAKKMKKRRELDALVSNGKLGRSRKPKLKKGEHELLRNESGSSEEEFSLPAQKTVSRK